MKERGKAVEIYNNEVYNGNQEYYYTTSSSMEGPCKKHPNSSSVGICAYCLKDRLINLVCSDCGEQRLSSCSCSEISSNARNSSAVDVGSVDRISFLLENDKKIEAFRNGGANYVHGKLDHEVVMLKRSNSSCVEMKKKGGLWRIKRLFLFSKKKSGKFVACERSNSVNGVNGFEERNNDHGLWLFNYIGGISRSRSLCSFRGGGGFFGSEDGTLSGARSSISGARSSISGARSSISGARSSISAARNSGVNGVLLFDPERKSGFSESEPRKSNFSFETTNVSDPEKIETRRVFSLKEGNFSTIDDSGFIDLKFDQEQDMLGSKIGGLSDSGYGVESIRRSELLGHGGGSCRITVGDIRGIKRSRKSFKSWRWIFRQHSIPKKKDSQFSGLD